MPRQSAASATPLGAGAASDRASDTRGALFYARFRAVVDPFLLRGDVWPVASAPLFDAAASAGSGGHNQPWYLLLALPQVLVDAGNAPPKVKARGPGALPQPLALAGGETQGAT